MKKSLFDVQKDIGFEAQKDIEDEVLVTGSNSYERIYSVVRQIPKGKVATYGQVAQLAGNKRWARVVGYALHVNPNPDEIPCYRVVNKEGMVSDAFAFGGSNVQTERLLSDGIEFKDGHVVMEKYQWNIGI